MIETAHEHLIRLAEVGRVLNPRRPVHEATVWRWCLTGLRGGDVRLESVKLGGVRYTSVEAVHRFVARLNDADTVPAPPNAAAEAADAALVAKGV